MWCWASSAEMVLSYIGIQLPQEQIVNHIKGFIVNQPGSVFDMVGSVNSVIKDINENDVVVSGQYVLGAPLTNVVYNHLKNKKPVILTYQGNYNIGHAVVLTGINVTNKSSNNGQVSVDEVHVFDPFPYVTRRGPYGQVEYILNDSLKHRIYKVSPGYNGNVQLKDSRNMNVGRITGMIFVDGTR